MSQVLFPRAVAITGYTFVLIALDGTVVTSGTTTAYYSNDGAAQQTLAYTPVHLARGQWKVNLSAGERDAKITGLLILNAAAVPLNINIISDSQLGAGATAVLLNSGNGASGAEFWVTYASSSTVVASGFLDSSGDATVYLDSGIYWLYLSKVGVNFTLPIIITVP